MPLNASVQWLGEEGAAQAQFPGVCRSKWLLPCKPQPHTSSGIDQALSFHAECYRGIAYCHAGEHDKCNKIKATAAGAGEPSSTTTSSTGSSSKKTSTKRRKKPITKCHGRRQQLESAGWQLAAATPPDGWTKDHTATPMQQRARYEQVVANRKYSQQYPSHKLRPLLTGQPSAASAHKSRTSYLVSHNTSEHVSIHYNPCGQRAAAKVSAATGNSNTGC